MRIVPPTDVSTNSMGRQVLWNGSAGNPDVKYALGTRPGYACRKAMFAVLLLASMNACYWYESLDIEAPFALRYVNLEQDEDVRFEYSGLGNKTTWAIHFSRPPTTTASFDISIDENDDSFYFKDSNNELVNGVFHERQNEIALVPGKHFADHQAQLYDLVLTWPNKELKYYIGTISDDTFENLPREKQEECDADCAANM